jgi:hypothetical protein
MEGFSHALLLFAFCVEKQEKVKKIGGKFRFNEQVSNDAQRLFS